MAGEDFTKAFGFMLAQEFQKAAPRDTGELARSFTGNIEFGDKVIKFVVPSYFESVEFGSKSHTIRVKNKKSLAVPIRKWGKRKVNPYGSKLGFPMKSKDGRFVLLGKAVRHPGNRPNPFVRDTINRKTEEIIKKTIDFVNK